MDNFSDIQQLWQQQKTGVNPVLPAVIIKEASQRMRLIIVRQYWTLIILGLVVAILTWYFFSVNAIKNLQLAIGLIIMVGAVIIRMRIEWISVRKFSLIKPDHAMLAFRQQLTDYLEWRRKVHRYYMTLLFGAYILGFILLLKPFNESLSPSMFRYVMVSGSISMLFMFIVIRNKVKQEVDLLKRLKDDTNFNS